MGRFHHVRAVALRRGVRVAVAGMAGTGVARRVVALHRGRAILRLLVIVRQVMLLLLLLVSFLVTMVAMSLSLSRRVPRG